MKTALQTQRQVVELFRSWEMEYNGMGEKRSRFGKALAAPKRLFHRRERVDSDIDLEKQVERTKKADGYLPLKKPVEAKSKQVGRRKRR